MPLQQRKWGRKGMEPLLHGFLVWEITQGLWDCFRSFQAVVLSHTWKQKNRVRASRASGGSRTSYFESRFHTKPTPLPSLTPLAVYLPSSHDPFSVWIQPTSLHVTLLRAVLRSFPSHFGYIFFLSRFCCFLPLYLTDTFHITIEEKEKKMKQLPSLPLFSSFSQSIFFTFPAPFLSLFVYLLCSTYASQQSRFPFLRL